MVLDEGKTVGAVARELDLTPSAADWVRKAQTDRTKGRTGLTGVEREELTRLRKEVPELRMERDVRRSPGLPRKGPPVKFAWIHSEKASYPVSKLCCRLGVTPSGYYASPTRPTSAHTRRDRQLKVLTGRCSTPTDPATAALGSTGTCNRRRSRSVANCG